MTQPIKHQILKLQKGYSTIELLISLTLGLMLTLGVVEVYSTSKQTYRLQEGMSRLQESARFALDIISNDLRMVGFAGCRGLGDITVNSTGTALNYSVDATINGNQSIGADGTLVSGSLPANLNAAWRVAHTDVLTIQSAGRCSDFLDNDMANATEEIEITSGNQCGFSENDLVLVSNCSTGDLFRITDRPNTTTLDHAGLSVAYEANGETEIMTYSANTYFVSRDNTTGQSALFKIDQTDTTPSPVPIIDGVENLQIEYGIDTDDDDIPNQFVSADAVLDWGTAVAVRVTLLMRTIENVGGSARNFNVGGSNVNYAEGPVRQQFSTTVKLRNRVLQRDT